MKNRFEFYGFGHDWFTRDNKFAQSNSLRGKWIESEGKMAVNVTMPFQPMSFLENHYLSDFLIIEKKKGEESFVVSQNDPSGKPILLGYGKRGWSENEKVRAKQKNYALDKKKEKILFSGGLSDLNKKISVVFKAGDYFKKLSAEEIDQLFEKIFEIPEHKDFHDFLSEKMNYFKTIQYGPELFYKIKNSFLDKKKKEIPLSEREQKVFDPGYFYFEGVKQEFKRKDKYPINVTELNICCGVFVHKMCHTSFKEASSFKDNIFRFMKDVDNPRFEWIGNGNN